MLVMTAFPLNSVNDKNKLLCELCASVVNPLLYWINTFNYS